MIEAIQSKKEPAPQGTRLPRDDSDDHSMAHGQQNRLGDGKSADGKPAKKPSQSKDKKSYQLRTGESLRKGVKRIVRGQLKKALQQADRLASGEKSADVHDIRKRFKRVRAVMRLMRNEIDGRAYRRDNAVLRDAGRALSDVRNGKVMLESLAALEKLASAPAREPCEVLGRFLRVRQLEMRDELKQNQQAVETLKEAIEETRKEVKAWSLPRGRRRSVRQGLKQAFKQARQAFEGAESAPTDENLHEFRKQAKYFYYGLQTVELLGPSSNEGLAEAFHELEQTLGEDHDLAMLRREASACQNGGLTGEAGPLLALIDNRRHDVQGEAMRRASELFRQPGNSIGKRIGAWPKKGS